MSKFDKEIERYISAFLEHVDQLSSVDFGGNDHLYKKCLYMSFFDSLSKPTASSEVRNRRRFVSFLESHSGWDNINSVSLPHLVKLTELLTSNEFSKLEIFAKEQLDGWQSGQIITLDRDPSLDSVKSLWPKGSKHKLANFNMENLTHKNLFWFNRNNLVHEMRDSGLGFDFCNGNSPYYHGLIRDGGKGSWELVYPIKFYHDIALNVLSSLEHYYKCNDINPYEAYEVSSYWLDRLNG